MTMGKEYYLIRLKSSLERANRDHPGLLTWSDIRFEMERERARRAEQIVRGVVADLKTDELYEAYLVVREQEEAERGTAQAISGADAVLPYIPPASTSTTAEQPKKRGKKR